MTEFVLSRARAHRLLLAAALLTVLLTTAVLATPPRTPVRSATRPCADSLLEPARASPSTAVASDTSGASDTAGASDTSGASDTAGAESAAATTLIVEADASADQRRPPTRPYATGLGGPSTDSR